MIHYKLWLNDDKSELTFAAHKRFHNHSSLPQSVQIKDFYISFSLSVRSLGVLLDQTLSSKHQTFLSICRVACQELRRMSPICDYLSVDANKTMICAFVLSVIDYCNSPVARAVFKFPKLDHVFPLRPLHLLPITQRTDYKLSSLCFSVINGTGPECLSELLTFYTPFRQLRSASDARLFRNPSFKTKTNGQRSFSSRYSLEQSPSNC